MSKNVTTPPSTQWRFFSKVARAGWIETVFNKRECSKFIPSNRDNARCCCGQLWQYHRDGSPATLRSETALESHWSPARHTNLTPTNAYGTLDFQGGAHSTKAQYIRLAHDTKPELIIELLTKEWGLEPPKLLITIQGGKTNFDIQPKLKKVLRKGLLKAAKTTGAWVFTGGTNTGVTRHAGEALASESSMRLRGGRVVSIGIAPWGVIERRQDLIGYNKDVPYHPIHSPKSKYVAVNSHHRFFLLVDNGTAGKYGAELILRRKLENFLSKQHIETKGSVATPVVCVVIEGGPQTIRQVLEYVTDTPPVPVIVCDGTGRAADILAFVHKYAVSSLYHLETNREMIVTTIERVFDLKSEPAEKLFFEILQCVKKTELITIFRLTEGAELDQSILSALLQMQKNPPEQLSLALTWNRVDIARSHVFNEDVEWPKGSLEQAMMSALVHDRIEFVKLLLEKGVTMNSFLTISRLEELYNSKQGPSNTLRYIIRDVKKNVPRDYTYTLIDIGLVINQLMGGAFRSAYTRKRFRTYYNSSANNSPQHSNNLGIFSVTKIKNTSPNNTLNKVHKTESTNSKGTHCPGFEYPFSELLVWAVLTKRQGMAKLMWQHGEEAVAKALVAAKLYKALAHEAADDDLETEVYEELRRYGKEFEVLALELLIYCYQQNDDRTHQLLTYELKNWSKQTCLQLAVAVNHRALLSHPCCQILLADLWLGGLRTRKNTNIKVLCCLLFPPMILLLGFRSKEELRTMPQTQEEHLEDEQRRYSDSESDSDLDDDNIDLRNENDPERVKVSILL